MAHLVESAPIESNMTEKPQSSASPAPQKEMSALLSWICSMPTPMQCAPVEHADEIEYETPCSLKAVESTAETVEPIERVTRYLAGRGCGESGVASAAASAAASASAVGAEAEARRPGSAEAPRGGRASRT